MNIEKLTTIVKNIEATEHIHLVHYKTDVVDYRFGTPDKYVAISFKKNNISTIMEFRTGLTSSFINRFNALSGVHASCHSSSKDMFVVRFKNQHFTENVEKLIIECVLYSVRKFRTAQY